MPGTSNYLDIYTGFVFSNGCPDSGTPGSPGSAGVGISNIVNGSENNIVITLTDSSQYIIVIPTVTGPAGTNGTDGTDGANGSTGVTGATGATGTTGSAGSNGTNGTNGSNGTNGINFLTGSGTPAGGLGNNTDSYLNLTNFDLYKKSAGAWGSPITNLQTFNNGLTINQTSGNILILQYSTVSVAWVDSNGGVITPYIGNTTSLLNGQLVFATTGTSINRNVNDLYPVFSVVQNNTSSTASIFDVVTGGRNVITTGMFGGWITQGSPVSAFGTNIANIINDALVPSANSDVMTALVVKPIFGTSTIATLSGSFTGGTGYPNGTHNIPLIGGTGSYATAQIVVSGGIITGVTLINGGVNYTVGDNLTLSSIGGSGFAINVATINTFTGLTNIAADFQNAPIKLSAISTPSIFVDGMIWISANHLYVRLAGVTQTII